MTIVMEVLDLPAAAPAVTTAPVTETFEEAFNKDLGDPANGQNVHVLNVALFDTHAEIAYGENKMKRVTHEAFQSILNTVLAVPEKTVEIPGISPPTNMFFFRQSATQMLISSYYAGGVKDLLYNSRKMKIAVPNIIVSHTLKKDGEDWLITDTKFLCTDLPPSKLPRTFIQSVDHHARIFLLPMSNTYDDGRMCYGNNQMPMRHKDNNFRGLDYFYRYMWETPFNNDLGIRAIRDRHDVGSWYNILAQAAKDGKDFPYHELNGYTALSV